MTTIRAYAASDGPAVAAFLRDASAMDPALLPMTDAGWASFVGRSFNHNGHDFAVAETDGTIVGLLMSTRFERGDGELRNIRVIVHPSHRRRGIARELLARVDGQDADDVPMRAETPGAWQVGIDMLKRRGFAVVERLLWMGFAGPVPDASEPEGIALRAYCADAEEDAAWRRLNREGYEGSSDYSDHTPEDTALMLAEPGFHLWLAEAQDGNVVGLCHTKEFGDEPWINSLVVSPQSRGHKLGRALLLAGMRTIREQGGTRIRLNVRADNEPAVALYKSVGFVVDDDLLEWQRQPGR